jgi:large subunit ribosomal protein L32
LILSQTLSRIAIFIEYQVFFINKWEQAMAVQKSRRTRSTRGMRRSHDDLSNSSLSVESYTGETHRRHHVSEQGYLRGKKVVHKVEEEHDDSED